MAGKLGLAYGRHLRKARAVSQIAIHAVPFLTITAWCEDIYRKKAQVVAKIPAVATKLSVGMHVSKLDRPGLETPFVCRASTSGTGWSNCRRAACSQVVVHVNRSRLTEALIRALMQNRSKLSLPGPNGTARDCGDITLLRRIGSRFRLGAFFSLTARKDGDCQITSTLRREAPGACDAWHRAVERQRILVNRDGADGTVRYGLADILVQPPIAGILRNPDTTAWTVFSGNCSGRR